MYNHRLGGITLVAKIGSPKIPWSHRKSESDAAHLEAKAFHLNSLEGPWRSSKGPRGDIHRLRSVPTPPKQWPNSKGDVIPPFLTWKYEKGKEKCPRGHLQNGGWVNVLLLGGTPTYKTLFLLQLLKRKSYRTAPSDLACPKSFKPQLLLGTHPNPI